MKKLLLILTLAAFAFMTNAPQVEAASAKPDSAIQAKATKSKKSSKKGKKGKKGKKKKKNGKKKAVAK